MPFFIDKFITHTETYESPGSFWKWAAYTAIAAVLRDSCYFPQGDGRLYPNIYTLILAPSGGHRKGKPLDLCETLVHRVNTTKIISGRSSVQAILDELSRGETDKKTGKITKGGSAIFFAPELTAGIVSDPEAIKILTDIYDYKSNPYKSRLRTGPCFDIGRIVFSMFSGTNHDMSKDFMTSTAVRGGLLARTFLVIPNEFRPSNSLTKYIDRSGSFDDCLESLKEVSRLTGEITLTEEAAQEYDNWYKPFRMTYQKRPDPSGVAGRIHTGILKLAIILAANELSIHVKKHHIEEAIVECLGLLPNYNVFVMSNGKSTISEAGGLVLSALLNCKDYKMSRKSLLMNHWNDIDGEILDKVVATLDQAGLITQGVSEGNLVAYQLTPKCIEVMKS